MLRWFANLCKPLASPPQVPCKSAKSRMYLCIRFVDVLGLGRTYWTYKVLAGLVQDLHSPCKTLADSISVYKVPCPP